MFALICRLNSNISYASCYAMLCKGLISMHICVWTRESPLFDWNERCRLKIAASFWEQLIVLRRNGVVLLSSVCVSVASLNFIDIRICILWLRRPLTFSVSLCSCANVLCFFVIAVAAASMTRSLHLCFTHSISFVAQIVSHLIRRNHII